MLLGCVDQGLIDSIIKPLVVYRLLVIAAKNH